MYKLSIIIPVYNAENCLNNAIDSIINQTIGFENIELILVDDKSFDRSRDIIEGYSNKYDNIVSFFAEKNHGFPGYGRNVGIQNASSKYVMFMDNDDELDYQMCEKLYNAIEEYNCDISCCDIKECDNVFDRTLKMGPKQLVGEYVVSYGDEILEYSSGFIWNKLFKKEIIDKFNIKFLTDNYCDDQAFCLEYMVHSMNMVYLNDYIGYYWLRRNESLSNSKELKNLEPLFEGYDYIFNFLSKHNKIDAMLFIYNTAVVYLIGQSVLLKSKSDKLIFYKKIYDFENSFQFNAKIPNPFFSLANFFILKRKFSVAAHILDVYDKLKNSSFLRKVYLKIYD